MPTNSTSNSKRLELSAEPRDVFGKHVRRLRRQGLVPANIYGHGTSRPIQAAARALEVLLAHGGRTGLVSIVVGGRPETALLKEIQRDPRSNQIVHMEFQAVSMTESVTSTVPIRFVGESPAVVRMGGILTHPRTEVRVTALASDLPELIEVDLSAIKAPGEAIHVSDLPESSTYKVIDAADDVLAMVEAPKEEAEAVEAEGPATEAETDTAAESAPVTESGAA